MRPLIHGRERATLWLMAKAPAGGRTPDEAVSWYCYMRVHEMIEKGATQKQLSELSKIPKSAINHLIKNAKGVGPSTAAAFVQLFGFETRGQLVDAADVWWAKEGKSYAIRHMRAMAKEREAKMSSAPPSDSPDETGERSTAKKPTRKTA
jgi:plasmid maintenance system antidote protein VapI